MEAGKKKKNTALKFPVLNNVEYMDIVKSGQTQLIFSGDELEGKTWRQVQELIGEKLGAVSFRYSLKFNGKDQKHNGAIRGVIPKEQLKKDTDMQPELLRRLDALEKNIAKLKGSDIPSDMIITVLKEGHANHVAILKEQLSNKQHTIDELKREIADLEKELEIANREIAKANDNNSMMQMIKPAIEFLKMKSGGAKPLEDKSMSDSADIPQSILLTLGVVDWQRVPPDVLAELQKWLDVFIQKLPMKG